jgi:hypothetical protein
VYNREKGVKRINALEMLSKGLAVPLASAIRQYVPPTSLPSVAAKESGPVVEALVKGGVSGDHSEANTQAAESIEVAGGVFSGIENFVGVDET